MEVERLDSGWNWNWNSLNAALYLQKCHEEAERLFFQQENPAPVDMGFRKKISYQLRFDKYPEKTKVIGILFKVDEYNYSPQGNQDDWIEITKKVIKHNNLYSMPIQIWYESQDKETGSTRECRSYKITMSEDGTVEKKF